MRKKMAKQIGINQQNILGIWKFHNKSIMVNQSIGLRNKKGDECFSEYNELRPQDTILDLFCFFSTFHSSYF